MLNGSPGRDDMRHAGDFSEATSICLQDCYERQGAEWKRGEMMAARYFSQGPGYFRRRSATYFCDTLSHAESTFSPKRPRPPRHALSIPPESWPLPAARQRRLIKKRDGLHMVIILHSTIHLHGRCAATRHASKI